MQSKPINLRHNYPVLAEQDAAWLAHLHQAVDRFGADSIRLPSYGGSLHNRSLAAEWLQLPLERTWICASGHHGLMATLLACDLVGKTIAVEAITYPWFLQQAAMLGIRVVSVALDHDGIDPDALRALAMRESIAALYTMATHHNPLGIVSSLQRRNAIVAIAREANFLLIEDAAYSFLVDPEPPRYTALAPELSFCIESLSKRVVPGLRTAFLAAPPHLAARIELALDILASGVSNMLASMGCEMTRDGSLAAILHSKRTEGAARLEKARAILKRLETTAGTNSWHIWVTLPDSCQLDSRQVESLCEANEVLISGGHWFAAPDAPVPRAVRVAFGGETDWSRVEQGLEFFCHLVLS